MNTADAIQLIDATIETAASEGPAIANSESRHLGWSEQARSLLVGTLGSTHRLVHVWDVESHIRREDYVIDGTNGRRTRSSWRGDALRRGVEILEAAKFAIASVPTEGEAIGAATVDVELWEHVGGLVTDGAWDKVPASTAIFVEDSIRRWAGDPRGRDGGARVGKDLYANVFAPDGPLRLGTQASEWEGWRAIAMGLAQAIGNVDRHRIQRRSDQRQYAMGVLGLGSLLLTQVRREHPDQIVSPQLDPRAEGG